MMLQQRNRASLPDRPMRAFFVVVPAPILHFFLRVRKVHEPMRIQTLRTEAAVEGLDEGIVGRLSRAREVKRDTMLVGPQIQIA